MIKNIIFDLDDTIIKNEKEYSLMYKDVLRKMGYDPSYYLKIYDAIDEHERTVDNPNPYDHKKSMITFINDKLNTDYPTTLIDELNKVIGKCWIKNIMLPEETIKYLSEKYDCYIFSNWFESAQTERLKNIGYLKYFKKVFGSDKYGSKPYLTAYQNVLKSINAKPEECIMVGDSKLSDIYGANQAGIKAILFDYDGNRDDKNIEANHYVKINDLKELKKIL